MKFLPIVDRELRVAARRRATYWSRALSALTAIVLGGFVYVMNQPASSQELGITLFATLAGASLLFCLLAGVRLTADCLSEEKREGTLGLLFLTDLKGYDIVLGKLIATSLSGFYGLLAVIPVLAFTLLLGGVTQGEFWRIALVLTNCFLFSLSVGIYISAVSRNPRNAIALTFCVLLFFNMAVPAFALWLSAHSHPFGETLLWLTPPAAFTFAFDFFYRPHFADFWRAMCLIHGLTLGFISLACLIVPRSWQDQTSAVPARGWRAAWHEWNYGGGAERCAFRQRLLDINAFYWLAGRGRQKPVYVWGFVILAAGFWFWGWHVMRKDWLDPVNYFFTAFILNSVLKTWIASEAGRQLGEDRKMGALELFLSTPLGERDIIRGQLLALQRQFLGPVLMVIAVEIAFLIACTRDSSFDAAGVGLWLAGIVLLVADMIALSWVGMWVALNAKKPNFAALGALLRVVVIPNAVFIFFFYTIEIVIHGGEPDGTLILLIWFGLRLVNDIVLASKARRRLHGDFRRIAVEQFSPLQRRFRRWLIRGN